MSNPKIETKGEVEVIVGDERVCVPETCTVRELREKADLSNKKVLYDARTGAALRDNETIQNKEGQVYGVIENWRVG